MFAHAQRYAVVVAAMLYGSATDAGIVVNYTEDFGGANTQGIEGMGARSTWDIDGNTLTILLENTSTAVPTFFEVSDSLLVSLAFTMPVTDIVSGDSAVISDGSFGLGRWSDLGAGDSVAQQWIWTNDAGGDLLHAFDHIISTSNGQGGGVRTGFAGSDNKVAGPFGGIAADPILRSIPRNQEAVTNGIVFTLTLTESLTEADLRGFIFDSAVEFGSDRQYLSAVPAPGALALLGLAAVVGRPRRRRRN